MSRLTDAEIGYSIRITGAVGDTATFPSILDTFYQNVDGEFTIVTDICFTDENYNIFFGGHNGLSHFHLIRNMNDGYIDLILIDAADAHRDYTWNCRLKRGKFYNLLLEGTANADNGIALEIDGVVKTIAAQQNDVGFSATATMSLVFGDHNGVQTGGFKTTKTYFYSRTLTALEKLDIKNHQKYPVDYVLAFDFKRPHIGFNLSNPLI